MNAVDTNVLIYVNDSRYPSEQAIAASLVANLTEGVLIWRVACEYLAASRKLEPFGYDRAQAYQYIRDLQQVWYTALPTWAVINRAEDLISRFSLSHWDSMVVAACLEANVETLYTEDFGYSDIDGLKIVNPLDLLHKSRQNRIK
ncbi:MAG: PIN domain-containing protein [Microcystis wesenbergii TW10]|uniref:PIN domain-containing protein n=1 Tax=Microcystis wesenbergii TW10 TaxID=2060474 RepID=A0A3E0LGW0_9CHRO|nr:MAG: PIN domain-containing protein [Microcystis wesenbergii TW10]